MNDRKIETTTSYKYLGIQIDSTLNVNTFFLSATQKASSRLSLLPKICGQPDVKAAEAIYESMTLPTITSILISFLVYFIVYRRLVIKFNRCKINL